MRRAHFGPGNGLIFLDNMRCRGDEASLLECRGSGLGNRCDHSEDAGVFCRDESEQTMLQAYNRDLLVVPHCCSADQNNDFIMTNLMCMFVVN